MTDSTPKATLGQAIDKIIAALESLDPGARMTALRAASAHLNLGPATAPEQSAPPPLPFVPGAPAHAVSSSGPQDIRSLKDNKQPGNALEMAALVAFYLQSVAPATDQKQEIQSTDLEKYFKQAGYHLPSRIAQVLIDAKGAGYFDAVSRGTYKLNPVGYNLVVHSLPRKAGSSGNK